MLSSLANKIIDFFASADWQPHLRNYEMVMRRRLPGHWEYREMNAEETEKLMAWQAIK